MHTKPKAKATHIATKTDTREATQRVLLILLVFALVIVTRDAHLRFQNLWKKGFEIISAVDKIEESKAEKRVSNNYTRSIREGDTTVEQLPLLTAPPLQLPLTTVASTEAPLRVTNLVQNGPDLGKKELDQLIQNMSVYEYRACCGLGHRLVRQAAAYHAAHKLGHRLNVNWGFCDPSNKSQDIFDELFRPENITELQTYVTSYERGEFHFAANEVPGYIKTKQCNPENLESDYNMYTELRSRYRKRDLVNAFVQANFAGKLVLGIHIRAGNGETGDFTKKNRGISSPEAYTRNVSNHILTFLNQAKKHDGQQPLSPPVLYIATDTARYIDLFRKELEGKIPVVHWEQEKEAEGSGVFLGQEQKKVDKDKCLQKWNDMLIDAMLLASADVLIAGQFSSFSQAIPFALVMGRPRNERKVPQAFCELSFEAIEFDCHEDKVEWCKNTKHKVSLRTLNPTNGWESFLKHYGMEQ